MVVGTSACNTVHCVMMLVVECETDRALICSCHEFVGRYTSKAVFQRQLHYKIEIEMREREQEKGTRQVSTSVKMNRFRLQASAGHNKGDPIRARQIER